MSSTPNLASTARLSADGYRDAMQTFEKVRAVCERLNEIAKTTLHNPTITLPLVKLVHYCDFMIRQCNVCLSSNQALRKNKFLYNRLLKGLRALGLAERQQLLSNEADDMVIVTLLVFECKRTISEVSDILDAELTLLDEKKRLKQKQNHGDCFLEQSFAAVKAVHAVRKSHAAGIKTPYMLRKTLQIELNARQADRSFMAFDEQLSEKLKCIRSTETLPGEKFPGMFEMDDIMREFSTLCTDLTTSLLNVIDPINVQTYKEEKDVPYIKLAGDIGAGSFGVVYKVEHVQTGAVYALKQIIGSLSSSHEKAVRKELAMLELCNHENLIQLVDAYRISEDLSTYLVMEPWAPYTLQIFLDQSDSQRKRTFTWFTQDDPETELTVVSIFDGLVNGLSYLHDQSIKHKDIKPDNILLYCPSVGKVRPIIADLGISKIYNTGNTTDFYKSTLAFLAPEQKKKIGSTLRSDIWQLGCCFALTLAVLRAGSEGLRDLWHSFDYPEEGCSYNIASESTRFMKQLNELCGHGTVAQLHIYRLVTKMLKLDPALRLDIKTVHSKLAALIKLQTK